MRLVERTRYLRTLRKVINQRPEISTHTSSLSRAASFNLCSISRTVAKACMSVPSSRLLELMQNPSSEIAYTLSVDCGLPNRPRQALERLMDEGIIFSTIDEAHFQVSQ